MAKDASPRSARVLTVPVARRRLLAALRAREATADTDLVARAIDFAIEAHADQTRASGEPYVTHPLAVATLLEDLGLDITAVVAALLHDVPEDTARTVEDVAVAFGSDVAALVDGVTKLSRAAGRSREEAQAETIRKMFLAMSTDIRVVLIKLADRVHNMRTLPALTDAAQRSRIARQTLEIYAPLAERLGMWEWKGELEDLAFAELEPERFAEISAAVATISRSRKVYIDRAIETLKPRLAATSINAEINGRPKHLYSIWAKMTRKNASFGQIYDAYAIRIIVDEIHECYAALGIVHALWPPIPGEFDDYIAVPKSNGYQSLHTAVIALDGKPLEIQIRTHAQHEASESGIASHFRYKEGSRSEAGYDAKLAWLRRLLDWQHDVADATELVEGIKLDLFADQIFVFTPAGAVKTLPAGAGPLDFAYLVHTDVGHHCIGARVNGRLVPFDHQLVSGDIVEILTTKTADHGPSRDWLKIVKTPHARSKIRAYFKRADRDTNIASGRESLERELTRLARSSLAMVGDRKLLEMARTFGLDTLEDFYAAIGYGSITASTVVSRLGVVADNAAALPSVTPLATPKPTGGVRVSGAAGLLTRFAGCCQPVPGDRIVGFVTRGKGITVHLASCLSVTKSGESARVIDVEWEAAPAATYPISIRIECQDRPGLLNDLTTAIAAEHMNIQSIEARVADGSHDGLVLATIAVSSVRQLARLFTRLEAVRGVESITRAS